MPSEIPDSDAESDFDAGPRAADSPFARVSKGRRSPDISDRDLDVNFDDFISQTQSAKDGSQLEQTKRSTAFSQKHLREVPDNRRGSASSSYDGADEIDQSAGGAQLPAATVGQRKRAYSEKIDDERGSSQNRSRRTKTYSSSTRRHGSSQDSKEPLETANLAQTAFPSPLASRPSSQAPQERDEEDFVPRAREGPRAISLLGNSVSNVAHVLSTSNSSMGGYQSINLDFRGSGTGLDINANLFSAFSQVSNDAENEITDEERRADLSSTVPLSASPRRPGRDAINPMTDAGFGPQSTTGASTSIDPSLLLYEQPGKSQMLTSPVATTAAETASSTFTFASNHDPNDVGVEAATEKVHVKSGSTRKRCGPKSTDSRQPSIASTPDEIADQLAIGLPDEQCKPRPSKSRGDNIEPEHQSQHGEDETRAKKKGRKKSAAKATEHSTSPKLPTSELNLSDEAIIGLPKEQYKPRPSRRRSRMIVEEIEAGIDVDTESADFKDQHDEPKQNLQSKQSELSQAIEVAEAQTPKLKKGKKAKVKRAKTSAAGLLKKSEPMISDGEEDVVWMDTKPATVKLDLPADLSAAKVVKEEATTERTVAVKAEKSKKLIAAFEEINKEPQPARAKTVTVEIPARVETEKPEPKNNRRNRKAVVDDEDDEEANRDLPTSPPNAASTVLKEKDTNNILPLPTPVKQTSPSSPPKPPKITHSPINANNKALYRVGLSRRSAIPPLLKIVKPPPAKQQTDKEKLNLDEEGRPIDLVAETMRKWREMGALD